MLRSQVFDITQEFMSEGHSKITYCTSVKANSPFFYDM